MTVKRILVCFVLVVMLSWSVGCKKTDLTGMWRFTLKWDERSVFEGPPPPPSIYTFQLKEGKLILREDYKKTEEVGTYEQKTSGRVKIRITDMKVILYGELTDKDHMNGDISYFPASEMYGAWRALRLN